MRQASWGSVSKSYCTSLYSLLLPVLGSALDLIWANVEHYAIMTSCLRLKWQPWAYPLPTPISLLSYCLITQRWQNNYLTLHSITSGWLLRICLFWKKKKKTCCRIEFVELTQSLQSGHKVTVDQVPETQWIQSWCNNKHYNTLLVRLVTARCPICFCEPASAPVKDSWIRQATEYHEF